MTTRAAQAKPLSISLSEGSHATMTIQRQMGPRFAQMMDPIPAQKSAKSTLILCLPFSGNYDPPTRKMPKTKSSRQDGGTNGTINACGI